METLRKHLAEMLLFEKCLPCPHGYRLISIENNVGVYMPVKKYDRLIELLNS